VIRLSVIGTLKLGAAAATPMGIVTGPMMRSRRREF
jgi:hypothetical protein